MTNRNKGIIYKTLDYKESSKLLFVYTPIGKITLVANGVKSYKNEFRHLAQYLTEIEFDSKESDMYSLQKAVLVDDYHVVKSNYLLTKRVSIIFELIDHLVTEDLPHDKVYHLLSLLKENARLAALVFPIKMLYLLGYALDFVGDDPLGFSVKEAKVSTVENGLFSDFTLEETVLLSKLYFYKSSELVLTEKETLVAERFIRAFYRYHLEYEVRALKE
ncbi:MAG: DNA repair protein RecO [Acholeplasma sp.]|nr:DNA repair protein RecO [Acholeplasma sp.]